jgi:hypothetical protein
MFGSEILEVAAGLIFIYWLLSLICSTVNEGIAAVLSTRAKDLEKAIRTLLNDPRGEGAAKAFYEHSLIKVLKKGNRKPSYIPPRTFGLVLKDILAGGGAPATTINGVRVMVDKISNDELKKSLRVLVDEAGSELGKLQEGVETWFNDMMDRVSGWYKRKVQLIILCLALGLVGAFNVDTFAIAKNLLYNAPVRAAIVAKADALVKESPSSDADQTATVSASVQQIKDLQKELLSLPVPFGWPETPQGFLNWLAKILGLLFTVGAISLGAPFWFEFLEKVLKIRLAQAGVRPQKNDIS